MLFWVVDVWVLNLDDWIVDEFGIEVFGKLVGSVK